MACKPLMDLTLKSVTSKATAKLRSNQPPWVMTANGSSIQAKSTQQMRFTARPKKITITPKTSSMPTRTSPPKKAANSVQRLVFPHAFEPLTLALIESVGRQVAVAIENARLHTEERAQRVSGHRDIIRRFGRFPHRNPVLGREHTREEEAFLAGGGFSG